MASEQQSVVLDDRGRATIGSHFPPGVKHLLVSKLPGGAVLLEPAEVVSAAEAAFRRDRQAMAEVEHAQEHRDEAVKVDLAARRSRREERARG